MKTLSNWCCLALGIVALTGCKTTDRVHVTTDEGPPRPASVVSMADPKVVRQLLDGFYGLEANSWRWTASHFSVQLGAPVDSSKNGATLKVDVNIPAPLIQQVKTSVLKVTIKGVTLAPESLTQPGTFTLVRELPANLFDGDPLKVDFALDKFIAPSATDARELGLIITSVGLEPRKSPPAAQ